MKHKSENYNLLVEDWIPILRTDGRFERVGIRIALTEAGRIRQIASSNPMDNVALLRLLLAVLQWCKPELKPEERELLINQAAMGIPSLWLEESLGPVEKPNTAFELLREKDAFFQDDSLTDVAAVAVTNLLHDLPSGSKIAHFRHTRDHVDGMCLACCALGIIRWSAVASAGTAGKKESMTAGINGNTPAYAVPIGGNLLKTLLFTWPSSHAVEGDAPVWGGAGEQSQLGFLKAMTWRSRRILLAPPDSQCKRSLSLGSCCYCGQETDKLIESIFFRPGWRRPSKEPWSDDPHLMQLARTTGKKAKETRIVPSWPRPNDPLEAHAGVWRTVMEGLIQRSVVIPGSATKFCTTLLATSQALYKHVGSHIFVLPGFKPELAKLLLKEIEWLRRMSWSSIAARGGSWSDPPKGHFVVGSLCAPGAKGHGIRSSLCARSAVGEPELETAFQGLMGAIAEADRGGDETVAQVLSRWRDEACNILRKNIGQVVDASIPGSPLRRQEAKQRAYVAVEEAARYLEHQQAKGHNNPSLGKRK